MKPASALIVASLVLNAGLLGAILLRPNLAPPALRSILPAIPAADHRASEATAQARAAREARSAAEKPAVRSSAGRSDLWAALDSDDLPQLVARLRAAGFSGPVIFAIVNAKLETRMADRVRAIVGDIENVPFWKADPMNSPNNRAFWESYSQLSRERSRIVRDLLGDDALAWPGSDPAVAKKRQFGDIAENKIELVRRIEDDYSDMISQVRASTGEITLPEDREKLALLEREKRADLAAVLTPAEFEDYLMRTSQLTMRLRNMFTIMDASEEEFRTIFKIQDAFSERIYPTTGGFMSSQMMEDRRAAQRQVNEQIKAVLPPQRYEEYLRSSSSEYQQLYRMAQRENVPRDAMLRAYAVRDNVAMESARIADDKSMSAEQKQAAMQSLAQKARTEIVSNLGPTVAENYTQAARWLTNVERGMAVTINPDGSYSSRPVAMPPPKQ